jgi:hypothetical protein
MKTKVGFLGILMIAGVLMANAQGGMQRRTPEERTKRVVDTIVGTMKLDAGQQALVQSAYLDFNKAWDKLRESTPQGERPGQEAMQKLTAERDEKLKKVLSADQFKKLKDEIEPAMRPRRQGGNN